MKCKWLIFCMLAVMLAGCDSNEQRRGGGERIVPEEEVTEIKLTIVLHDSYDELRRENDMDDIDGVAYFYRGADADRSLCEVHVVRPEHVDDYETETLGHEVLHCVFGLYHR